MSFFFIFITVLFAGCANQSQTRCEPMLFPFVEYDYCANTLDLNEFRRGLKVPEYTGREVELFTLKLNVNADWRLEKISENTFKFIGDNGRSFSFRLEMTQPYSRTTSRLTI
jgi:hypothetical protein